MQLLKKISTRTVYGSKADIQKLVLDDQKSNHLLYRVYGEAKGYVSGTSKFSDKDEPSGWTAIAGEFEAVSAKDGEVFNAAICFLPGYVTGPIVERLKSDDTEGVIFGFDIYAKYDEKAATSYVYLAEPLRRQGETSPLELMREGFKPLQIAGGSSRPALIEGHAKAKK